MGVEKGEKIAYTVGAIIASALLFWALERHPYGYYTLLRWITCGVCIYGLTISHRLEMPYLSWPLGIVALVFNPIIPFHLDRETWRPIDIISGIFIPLTAIIIWFRRSPGGDQEDKQE
jgi:hypothetical protein